MSPRRTLLAVAATAATAAALPAAAQAALTYQTGALKSWVWIANDSGSGAHRLAPGASPHIAPDGRTVVYLSRQGSAHQQLRAIPAAGGHVRTLLRSWTYGAFAYSPNSRWVVATAGPQVGAQWLTLIDMATGRTRVLARGVFSGASFSPDSSHIAYDRAAYRSTGLPRPDLYVTPTAAGRAQRLTRDHRSSQPVWGPRWIAYSRWQTANARKLNRQGPKSNLWLIGANGHGRRQLTHDKIPFLLTGLVPTAWSADGTRLLAQFGGQDTTYAKTVNPATGKERTIGRATENGIVGTALSRDGSTILGYDNGIDPSNRTNVVTVPYTGGRAHVLVRHATQPSWTR